MKILVTVFQDATHSEVDDLGRRKAVGWFDDEISAVSAACESLLLRSAVLPEMRRLPALEILYEYRTSKSGHQFRPFARGLRTKVTANGRGVVRRPWSEDKDWLRSRVW